MQVGSEACEWLRAVRVIYPDSMPTDTADGRKLYQPEVRTCNMMNTYVIADRVHEVCTFLTPRAHRRDRLAEGRLDVAVPPVPNSRIIRNSTRSRTPTRVRVRDSECAAGPGFFLHFSFLISSARTGYLTTHEMMPQPIGPSFFSDSRTNYLN